MTTDQIEPMIIEILKAMQEPLRTSEITTLLTTEPDETLTTGRVHQILHKLERHAQVQRLPNTSPAQWKLASRMKGSPQ